MEEVCTSCHAMHSQRLVLHQASSSFGRIKNGFIYSRNPAGLTYSYKSSCRACHLKVKSSYNIRRLELGSTIKSFTFQSFNVRGLADGSPDELSDEDEELCPVECVREFKTDEEFLAILEKSKQTNSLVVVDFYRTACGSCKYIEQGFAKLCRGAGEKEAAVIFLKHNVIDEYDEQSEVAERLRIKSVPLFHFYKNGNLLEAFPTRDKERVLAAIQKYTAPAAQSI